MTKYREFKMMTYIDAAVLVLPGYFRVGHWHVPIYGLFAAAGLVLAMWLSQRTARLVGLDEEKFWDAGMFGIFAAFVASRVLLVAENWQAFLRFPVMVLALPSLTYGGMALTALLVFGYLRWKKLPVLHAMDAWAPCAAAAAAVLSLGHFIEGTDAGMPTRLPWGVRTPGDTVLGKTHPVQLYAFVAWLWVTWLLFRKLTKKIVFRKRLGDIAGVGLWLAGLIAFFLDMLRQPWETNGNEWLDPAQWFALVLVAAGIWLLFSRPRPPLSRVEAAIILEHFVFGGGGAIDHEIIEYGTFTDPLLREIQEKAFFGAMDDEEQQEMLNYAKKLREHPVEQESEMA